MGDDIRAGELLAMGWEQGPCIGEALRCAAGMPRVEALRHLEAVLKDHEPYLGHERFGGLARMLAESESPDELASLDEALGRFGVWGRDGIDRATVEQMAAAARIPPAIQGALMPDAHLGYGLPIGGVLALDNAVMPYGVGVDIACRMMLTVLPLPPSDIDVREDALRAAIEKHTRFGLAAAFRRGERRRHAVMDRDWSAVDGIVGMDTVWDQLGSSGGGNHFVDIGEIEFAKPFGGTPAGRYVAILTHSGSRGLGSKVANHFTRIAQARHPSLPAAFRRLAWLSLDDGDGQAYWAAMELAGEYASANHHCIHAGLMQELGLEPLVQVENHHNFAWREAHGGREVIVHRKGATPAGKGVLGVIPGSMATPGYLVRGKGNPASLDSAAHGAGRTMSRTAAREAHDWPSVREQLRAGNVRLISGGLDEVPGAYKPIGEVMSAQDDLVEVVARFDPRLVKMAEDSGPRRRE